MQVKVVMMYWTSQDSPERYEKPQIVFLIVCMWYDIKNIYLIETRRDKSPATLVKEVGELAGQKNNNVNDDLNRHFEEVYEKTKRSVTLYLIAKCKGFDDINDVLQEVYMEYFRTIQRKGIEYVDDEEAFLIALCKRKLASYYSFWDRISNRISLDVTAASELNDHIDHKEQWCDMEEDFYRKEMLQDVKKILEQQPDCVQKIFYLYYTMELTVSEIAELLRMKPQTVKNNLFRTRKYIRKLLEAR